jgi:hypothetical protein
MTGDLPYLANWADKMPFQSSCCDTSDHRAFLSEAMSPTPKFPAVPTHCHCSHSTKTSPHRKAKGQGSITESDRMLSVVIADLTRIAVSPQTIAKIKSLPEHLTYSHRKAAGMT